MFPTWTNWCSANEIACVSFIDGDFDSSYIRGFRVNEAESMTEKLLANFKASVVHRIVRNRLS